MKMILAIVNADDAPSVIKNLTKNNFQVTRLATSGGFLMAVNVTILIGVEPERVEEAIGVIRKYSKSRKQIMPTSTEIGIGMSSTFPLEVSVGGATVFVLDVDQFEKL